jgi:hypothetical protein
MSDRTIVLWMIAAFAWATPVAAQSAAPTTTAFDGTYVGVSRTLEGGTYQQDPATTHSSDIPPSGRSCLKWWKIVLYRVVVGLILTISACRDFQEGFPLWSRRSLRDCP